MLKKIRTYLLICISIITCTIFVVSAYQSKTKTTKSTNISIIYKQTNIIKGYKNWIKINTEPTMIPSKIAILCAAPTIQQMDKEKDNPHNDKYINVFVNEIGKQAMLGEKNPVFPIGSIIVKEKLTNRKSTSPELLTVMVKREKGFNQEIGDWEFLVFNGNGTEQISGGKLNSCQSCHITEKDTDYIFRNYLPNEISKNLK